MCAIFEEESTYVANFYPIFNDHIECCVLSIFCFYTIISYTIINDVDYLLEALNGIAIGLRVKLSLYRLFIHMC